VRLALAVMPAFAERAPVAGDHRTDGRIGGRFGDRPRGEFDRAGEVGRVRRIYGLTSTPFQKAI